MRKANRYTPRNRNLSQLEIAIIRQRNRAADRAARRSRRANLRTGN